MTATKPRPPSPSVDASEDDVVDGRRLRRERNRTTVVDALLDLYGEGTMFPSAEDIAFRAGLSPRSLFRYFDDLDDLVREAIDHQLARVSDLIEFSVDATASTDDRVDAVVAHRVRLFDAIEPVARIARMRASSQPLIATQLDVGRRFLRRQIKMAFAPELGGLDPHRSVPMATAIDVMTSFEAYQLLRHDHCLSRPRAAAVMADAIATLLANTGRRG